MNEFDYNASDMDQSASIKTIPTVNFTSLANSRSKFSSSRKVLMDLEYFIEESKNKENMRMENMRERQKNIGNEVTKQQIQKDMKMKQIEKKLKEKEMKECTFKPKTNTSMKKEKNRNFNEFLESQNAHTKKILQKRQRLKKNIEDKNAKALQKQQVPRNTKTKKNDKKEKNGVAVHERLYALKDKDTNQTYDQPNNTFKPQINERSKNIIRMAPVQELLYNQALRRQENDAMMQMNKNQVKYERPNNQVNDRYAAQKFIKEYFFILEELDLNPSANSTIDYLMFNQILKNLGFVSTNEDSENQLSTNERTLIHDAYQILEGFKPNARNICVFLLGIIGIYHINPVNFEEGEQSNVEENFNLDQIQGRKLQRHFDLFFRNRLTSDIPRRFQEQIKTYSFQPKINPLSEQMAQKHRASMLQKANQLIKHYPELAEMIPQDGIVTHTDLLVLHKVAKQIQKEIKKTERQSEQLKDCTFKPITMSSSISASQMIDSKTGFKKSVELYQYHKEIQNKKESLTASRQQYLDPQCTFQPQTNGGRVTKQQAPAMSKQEDETLFRMHKGREENEKKKKFLQRGEKEIKMKEKVREPILLLDVNLGQGCDKITIFEGDQNRLKQIAQQFGKKHNLDEESQERLVQMLEDQLKSVLMKVQEEENWSQEEEDD